MKINEKEKLLITVLAIVLIAVFYFMFLMPPVIDNIQALKEQTVKVENDIAVVQRTVEESDAEKEKYKFLNARINTFCQNFFPRLEQERIIMVLDQLLEQSGLQGKHINFSEASNLSYNLYLPDKISEIQSLQDLPSQEATVGYTGSFNSLLSFLGKVDDYKQKILVKDVNLINASTKDNESNLTGIVALEFYAIPTMLEGTIEDLTWAEEDVNGISDPFSGISLVEGIIEAGQEKCDLVLTVKPITADLPTVVLGLDADISAESFVFADNPGIVDAELRLFMKDGKYLCSYKAGNEQYPSNYTQGVEIPFVINEQNISLKIYSKVRQQNVDDQSGVNLSLYNDTDKPLNVSIVNDDQERPRVNIFEQTSNVIINTNE